MEVVVQVKGNEVRRPVAIWEGRLMGRISDFDRLILKLDRAPKSFNSLIRLGNEIVGFDRWKRTSSAYAESLCSVCPTCRPVMSGLARTVRSRGSKTKANKRGDRGNPCLVPFLMGNLEDRVPFTLT